jgi:TolB-like protein
MIFRFGASSLDTDRCELRTHGVAVPVEPQVFALIRLLVENRDRLVGRDEVVEKIWNGRIVSDSAISSRLKSARAALGDDGARQQVIRTVPKLGFRFVAEVETAPALAAVRPAAGQDAAPEAPRERTRPSIAVLPFTRLGLGDTGAWMADALPHDLIVALSRLRWLFVIARGSSFRFRGAEAGYERVREALQVRYCLSGVVETDDKTMTVIVELCDTHDGGVV